MQEGLAILSVDFIAKRESFFVRILEILKFVDSLG